MAKCPHSLLMMIDWVGGMTTDGQTGKSVQDMYPTVAEDSWSHTIINRLKSVCELCGEQFSPYMFH